MSVELASEHLEETVETSSECLLRRTPEAKRSIVEKNLEVTKVWGASPYASEQHLPHLDVGEGMRG